MSETQPRALADYLDQQIVTMLENFERAFPRNNESPEGLIRAAALPAHSLLITDAEIFVSCRAANQQLRVQANLKFDHCTDKLATALAKDYTDPDSPETTPESYHEYLFFWTHFPTSSQIDPIRDWIQKTEIAIWRLVENANSAIERHNARVEELMGKHLAAMKRASELSDIIGGALRRTATGA